MEWLAIAQSNINSLIINLNVLDTPIAYFSGLALLVITVSVLVSKVSVNDANLKHFAPHQRSKQAGIGP